MDINTKKLKIACYSGSLSMSIVSNLSPLLFLTFRDLYGISYSLLGLLILINYISQLTIDLCFSFFSHKINIPLIVKITPIISIIGLLIYALWAIIFNSNVYIGLVIGTIIFSSASGFNEVLISPIIEALPSENKEREMSKLHSVFAFGVVGVMIIGTLFLLIFKKDNWPYLALLFTLIPLLSFIYFIQAKIPDFKSEKETYSVKSFILNKQMWLCAIAIFLGGAAEVAMSQWSSSYLERAFNIDKVWGDIFGVAIFALMLGLGRYLYGKFGKNLEKVLLVGSIGASICYILAIFVNVPIVGLLACGITGLCVSMLWPGTLSVVTKRVVPCGVFVFALMAAMGDLGAAISPQLVGVVTDGVIESLWAIDVANSLSISVEQLSMRVGMLFGLIFPLLGIIVFSIIYKSKNKEEKSCH